MWFKSLLLRFLHFELWEKGSSKIVVAVSRQDYGEPTIPAPNLWDTQVLILVPGGGKRECSALPFLEVSLETLWLLKLALAIARFKDLRKGVLPPSFTKHGLGPNCTGHCKNSEVPSFIIRSLY